MLARGYEYATAREWALKLKELARVFADPYSAADFEHGPLALLERGVPVMATVRPGPTAASLVGLLRRLRVELDADLAVVSEQADALSIARWPFALPAGTPEWLGPIVSIVVGPMFGPSLGLPAWLLDLSPFTHVPNAPAVAINLGPVLGLTLLCALLAALGAATLRHRDLALPA